MNQDVSAPTPTPTHASTPASSPLPTPHQFPQPAPTQFPHFRFRLSIGKSSFNSSE